MIKIKNPLAGMTWRTIPGTILLVIYMGVGTIHILAMRFIDAAVFLMFGVGMLWYVRKIREDSKGIWFEVTDIEE